MAETNKRSLAFSLHPNEHEKKSDLNEQSLKDFIVHQAEKYFVDNIPIETIKELPGRYVYYLGALAYGALVGIFAYFFYVNYIAGLTQPYIALNYYDGECESVPISITNSFLADSKGHWFGEPSFVYSSAKYELVLNNFKVGQASEYTEMMDFFKADLDFFAVQLSKQSAAENLIFWMSYINYYSTLSTDRQKIRALGDGNVQYFQLTGDPSVVFNKEYNTFSLSNENGTCNAPSFTSYIESGTLKSELDYENYLNSENCFDILDPRIIGYTSGQFQFNLDVRSFSSAMSVNMGMIRLTELRPVLESIFSFTFQDVTYNVSRFFDFRYPTMDAVYCAFNVTETSRITNRFCTVAMTETLFLPVFNHLGARTDIPEYCDCETEAGNSQLCNEFRMMLGLLFYKPSFDFIGLPIEEIIGRQMVLFLRLLELNQGFSGLNRNSYNASFFQSAGVLGDLSSNLMVNRSVGESYQFCDLGNGVSCGLINFFEYDVRSYTISKFQYQLVGSSCVDTISIPGDNWDLLANNPPTELVQDYVECVPSFSSNVVNALGVASGNTSLAMILVLIVLMPLIYWIMVGLKEIPTKPEYSDRDLQEASHALCLVILRIRDGNTNGLKSNGVMRKMVKELITAANNETILEHESQINVGSLHSVDPDFHSLCSVEIDPLEFGRMSTGPLSSSNKQDSKLSFGSGVSSRVSRPKSSRVKLPLNFFNTRIFSDYHKFASEDFPTLRDLPINSSLKILNLSIDSFGEVSIITMHECKILLQELRSCFQSIVLLKHKSEKSKYLKNAKNNSTVNYEHMDHSVEDAENFFSKLQKGNELSQKLANINFEEFMEKADALIFLNLLNILSMHASVILNVEMGEIPRKYGKIVGYNIGGRVLTYSDILELSDF